jgi:Na+/H+-translocating membrane pyrophosphatase
VINWFPSLCFFKLNLYCYETGAATNIIYGLALGYRSTILPVSLLSIVVYISFYLGDMYGVALAALGGAAHS